MKLKGVDASNRIRRRDDCDLEHVSFLFFIFLFSNSWVSLILTNLLFYRTTYESVTMSQQLHHSRHHHHRTSTSSLDPHEHKGGQWGQRKQRVPTPRRLGLEHVSFILIFLFHGFLWFQQTLLFFFTYRTTYEFRVTTSQRLHHTTIQPYNHQRLPWPRPKLQNTRHRYTATTITSLDGK